MTIANLIQQSLATYMEAVSFAQAKKDERALSLLHVPKVPEFIPGAWRNVVVELLSVDAIVAELKIDRGNVCRRLNRLGIRPIYHQGAKLLYAPSVLRKLR